MQFLTSEQRKCRDVFSTAGDKSKHILFQFYEIYKFKIQIEAEFDSHGASVRAFKLSFDLDTQKMFLVQNSFRGILSIFGIEDLLKILLFC